MLAHARAACLTGRNLHTNGMGIISELASGYPGYDGMPKPSRGYISEILHEEGYATFALGKWHQVPPEEMSVSGPYIRWPLGRGFDRYYGFLGAETDHFHPDLVYDNHYAEPPKTPEEGYHLTDDLTDKAIGFIRDLRSVDPSKPFFMYYCPGATHAPHQAPRAWIEKYKGRFDAGWDAYREHVHKRQLEMGIIPPGTELSPRPDWVRAWNTLSADEKKLYARMMEIFAGFLSHADDNIGRLVSALQTLGDLDNTIIVFVSDNGASGEGGYFGSFNENLIFNGVPDTFEQNFAAHGRPRRAPQLRPLSHRLDHGREHTVQALEEKRLQRRHCRSLHHLLAQGHQGARRSPPAVLACYRYHADHARCPAHRSADAVEGRSSGGDRGNNLTPTFADAKAPEVRTKQYYELYGSRAMYLDGWKAVTFHAVTGVPADGPGDPNLPFTQDEWELYNVNEDFSECHNLAAQRTREAAMVDQYVVRRGR